MKRILFICFVLMLCLCMSISCLAQDVGEGKEDIKGYIQERILPVVVGVLTSLIALGTMLFKITSTLKSLKSTRDTFEGEARLRAELARELKAEAQKLQEAVKDVPALKACVEGLAQECRLNSEILSLGFSANGEIIKSGKGKQMAVLLENAKFKEFPNTTKERVGDPEKEVSVNETI